MEEKHQHVSLKLPFHQTGMNALEIISNMRSPECPINVKTAYTTLHFKL